MPGLLRGVARTAVIAGTATSVSNRVSRRQAGRWAQQDAQRTQPAPAAPPPTSLLPEDEMSNKIAQLKDLGDLKSQGVLSQSEFEAQKARILAS
ncbi:SHOCT domain-containing protein [Streptomyces sp. NPDC088256]|uniref:SHOCT domain-containing protein n=1 Tax=Streptomyces sp. NPDC088256 TaxID=3365848 RepID=UPI0038146DEF